MSEENLTCFNSEELEDSIVDPPASMSTTSIEADEASSTSHRRRTPRSQKMQWTSSSAPGWLNVEAIATRVEASASSLEAIASSLEAIASSLEAIAMRLEAITISNKKLLVAISLSSGYI